MFTLRSRSLISPEMSKYINDTTNKSLEKYKNNIKLNIPNHKNDPPNFLFILPFVSLISFLAGYKLSKLIK